MRTDKFKMIPETLILDERITKNDLVVYVALSQFKNNTTQRAFPSIATLCKISRLSKNPVKTSLKHLAELGYIEISRRFDKVTNSYTSNVYTLLDASKIDIEPLNEEKGHEKEVEEVKVEAKKSEPNKLEKKAPKMVEKVAEEDNRPMYDIELEEAIETKEEDILEEKVETMEDVAIVENTSQEYDLDEEEYDLEEEEEFSKNWAYQERFNKVHGIEHKKKEPKKVVKQNKAVDFLLNGLKSSKITY